MSKRVAALLILFLLVMLPVSAFAQVEDTGLLIGLSHYWPLDEASGVRYDAHGTADLADHNTVGHGPGVRSTAPGEWWLAGGISETVAIAAYDPILATSLIDSYTDRTGNGNDAVPGVAPTWDAINGWKGNGTTTYLNTGLAPSLASSIAIRFSGTASDNGYLAGAFSAGSTAFGVAARRSGLSYFLNGGVATDVARSGGVLVIAGKSGYYDGSFVATIPSGGVVPANSIYLLGLNNGGALQLPTTGYIQAVAMYNDTLTASQVLAVSNVMNALDEDMDAARFTAVNYEYLSTNEIESGAAFTIAGWINPTEITTATQTIANQDGRFWLGYDDSGYYAELYQNGTSTETVTLSSAYPITTAYTLLTLTYDGTAAALYVNNLTPATAVADLTGTITNTLLLGTDNSTTYYLAGSLDEVGLWSVALEPVAVNAMYNNGLGLLYEELYGAIVNSDPSIVTVPLPSGGQGVVMMSMTAGDVAILVVLSVLVLLAIYSAIRGMTTSAKAK